MSSRNRVGAGRVRRGGHGPVARPRLVQTRRQVRPPPAVDKLGPFPQSSDYGICKTDTARFWPWL